MRAKFIRFFVFIFFVALYVVVQPQSVNAQEISVSPTPEFTSIGDCAANENCPSPEQSAVDQPPVDQAPQTQPEVTQAPEQNNSQLIGIIQKLIDLLKQLISGGGSGCQDAAQGSGQQSGDQQGGQQNGGQVVSNYASDIAADSRGKKKWKKKKKGLWKKWKCRGQKKSDGAQQGGGQQQGSGQQQQDGGQNGGQQQGGQQGGADQQNGGQQQGGGQQQQDGGQNGGQQQGGQQGGADQQNGGQQQGGGQQEQPTVAPTTPPAGGGGSTVTGACSGGVQATEPAHDYTRTTHGGKTVNQRTKNMLQIAEGFAGDMGVPVPFTLSQGSYNTGVAASAGTHDGGGVVDISVNSMDTTQRNNAVRALRLAGFAAWLRSPAEGFAYHIHANAIGDREMAPVAMSQVDNYFDGLNGLAGNGQDTAPASVGRPIPSWATAYGTCN